MDEMDKFRNYLRPHLHSMDPGTLRTVMQCMLFRTNPNPEDELRMFAFTTCGQENAEEFLKEFEKYHGDINAFLHRDSYIGIRASSATMLDSKALLLYETDVDGVVIEWNNIAGYTEPIDHVQLFPPVNVRMKYARPLLKKHLPLHQYCESAIEMFRKSFSHQLWFTNGWSTEIAFIPNHDCTAAYEMRDITRNSLRMLQAMKDNMQEEMTQYRRQGTRMNTIVKNNLHDLRRMFVLPDDRKHVLRALHNAIEGIQMRLPGFRTLVFTYRFGEKTRSTVKLPVTDDDIASVRSVTVHAAVNIRGNHPNERENALNLFWSRDGVNALTGGYGGSSKAYSFTESCNFQSELGRPILHKDLKSVCYYPDGIRFVQLYADTPHRVPKCRMHAVSAAIINAGGVLSHSTLISEDARTYISEMRNNFENLTDCSCRLEMVVCLPRVKSIVKADEIMSVDQTTQLVNRYPLFTPFNDARLVPTLRAIGLHLVDELQSQFQQFRETGESNAVWQVYQNEIAIEKLIFGRPACSKSRQYAINLGPGVEYASRCKTDYQGFLTLEESTSCCEDEWTTPPLGIYTGSEIVAGQLSRMFGMYDNIGSSTVVIGERLLHVLLKDLHVVGKLYDGFGEFLSHLKSRQSIPVRYRVVGGISGEQFTDLLMRPTRGQYPMVFVRLREMLVQKGIDVKTALMEGVNRIGLRFVPAVRPSVKGDMVTLSWTFAYGLWRIVDASEARNDVDRLCEEMTPLVSQEMIQRDLCHAYTVRNKRFSWMRTTIERLKDENLNNNELIKVLSFVSCVGLLMMSLYVDYDKLEQLNKELPMNQYKLRDLGILHKFEVSFCNKFRLFRLHPDLSKNLSIQDSEKVMRADNKTPAQPLVEMPVEPYSVQAPLNMPDEMDPPEQSDLSRKRRHEPASSMRKWSPAELSILGTVTSRFSDKTVMEQYQEYRNECSLMELPDRNFGSFRMKIRYLRQ